GVLVSLSLVALLVQKLVRKAGLTFYDRLGGGILGTATGACVVLFLLLVMNMFFPQSRAAEAATTSQSMRLWSWAIDRLGSAVPNELRKVLNLAPLQSASMTQAGEDPGNTAARHGPHTPAVPSSTPPLPQSPPARQPTKN